TLAAPVAPSDHASAKTPRTFEETMMRRTWTAIVVSQRARDRRGRPDRGRDVIEGDGARARSGSNRGEFS
ncbi:MAG: hypothetical protein LBJ08_06665, partial [Bifidobacteriaceae bacterium]|nr:hypothetical protein [Bifidobacteriaceae bacterium]